MENQYISNDLIFLQDESQEIEKIAVSFVKKNANARSDNLEKQYYLINVYNMEKKLLTKQSKSEVKKLTADENSD